MPTALIIAPDFGPSSLPPATRVRFFAKHLPEFGWEPVVQVFIHPTVPNSQLLSRIAEHDIGLALETPEIQSRNLTITNKVFQYLQAGLAVIATDTIGSEKSLHAARESNRLLRLTSAKAAALKSAEEEYCLEKRQHKLLTAAEAALQGQAPKPESANLRFATAS